MKKIINKINSLLLLLSVFFIFFAACKKKPDATPITPQGLLAFHLHTNIDSSEAVYGTTYHLADGTPVSLSRAQLYISNIRVIKADGSIVPITGKILLKKEEQEVYNIDSVPAGNYNTVMFDIGLDSTTNLTDATMVDTSSVLSIKDSMWYGWPWEGFKFVNVQGEIDTSAAKNGSKMTAFSYNAGSQRLRKTITMPTQPFSVQSKQLQYVHITIDYGKLFNGLNLQTQLTGVYNNTNATQAADNIVSMFRYEQ